MKRRNFIAKDLLSPKYRPKVVEMKKKKKPWRKKKHKKNLDFSIAA